MNRFEKTGAWVSLLVGLPIVIVAAGFTFLFPLFLGDGSRLFNVSFELYVMTVLVLFILTLWFSGRTIGRAIMKGAKGFSIVIKYGVKLNVMFWATFLLTDILTNKKTDLIYGIIIPFFLAFVSVILTPLLAGFPVYAITKFIIENIDLKEPPTNS